MCGHVRPKSPLMREYERELSQLQFPEETGFWLPAPEKVEEKVDVERQDYVSDAARRQ